MANFNFWNFVAGLLGGGVIGSLLTLQFTKNFRAAGSGSVVDQSRAAAGGDVVAGDKSTTTKR